MARAAVSLASRYSRPATVINNILVRQSERVIIEWQEGSFRLLKRRHSHTDRYSSVPLEPGPAKMGV